MKNLLLATNNKHKIEEIKNLLSDTETKVLSLDDINLKVDITEDGNTVEENAIKKAEEIYKASGFPVISDDTGLFVDVLNGAPGVHSSRYAGENATYDDNCHKLLEELKHIPENLRKAKFITVVCYYENINVYFLFEGICRGKIITEKKGSGGFGYDPLFIPNGSAKTYAELSLYEKNLISHRAMALNKFKKFYKNR